ncbi:MAG: recombination protein RecR [Legionellales bacterium]|nr:recombination protein RecR [Legionellales bacterium]|tara:strand:- start:22633 stop:23229 length:597 start_codon:yes stop_codon:yes gene_type:complete
MSFSPLLEKLVAAFRSLPGVGPKSAQRMAFHLLARDRQGGIALADALQEAMADIGHCLQCRNFSETDLCQICENPRREQYTLCIVESPADVIAVEQTGYRGLYFVLLGHLSPIDGVGPNELGIDKLKVLLGKHSFTEVILATNPTVEGNTTAHYLSQLIKTFEIPCTRIAHGVPIGGELEYIDGGTLAHALAGRETIT